MWDKWGKANNSNIMSLNLDINSTGIWLLFRGNVQIVFFFDAIGMLHALRWGLTMASHYGGCLQVAGVPGMCDHTWLIFVVFLL